MPHDIRQCFGAFARRFRSRGCLQGHSVTSYQNRNLIVPMAHVETSRRDAPHYILLRPISTADTERGHHLSMNMASPAGILRSRDAALSALPG